MTVTLAAPTALTANAFCVFPVKWTPTTTPGTREVTVSFGTASINLIGRVLTGASLLAVPSPIAQTDASGRLRQCGGRGRFTAIKTITIMNVGELETTDDLTVVNTAAGAAGASQRGGSHDVSG